MAYLLFSFLQAISQSPNCGEYHFLLGRLYWDMGEETRKDRSKAHTHLLKVSTIVIDFWVVKGISNLSNIDNYFKGFP